MKSNEVFLKKFSRDEISIIKKYLLLREQKKVNEDITIFEPLVKDVLEVGNGSIDEHTFLNRNISIPENEIQYLPVRTYKKLVSDVLGFTEDKEEAQTEEESIKKN